MSVETVVLLSKKQYVVCAEIILIMNPHTKHDYSNVEYISKAQSAFVILYFKLSMKSINNLNGFYVVVDF